MADLANLKDDELLQMRICDLGVRIEGSELEPRVMRLHERLAAHGLPLLPRCYLGDEWFSPEGVPAIAIPFYLAHPRLRTLELHQMLEVEGGTPDWCDQLLSHECGHAYDHAYRFSSLPSWRATFGDPREAYAPETYRPRPYSRSFVRHLPNWYAQSHPVEDFAETFAVWLMLDREDWRVRYQGWKALAKLEYVDKLMRRAARRPPRVRTGRLISDAAKLKKTLARHYAARRKAWAEDYPDFYDADLRRMFSEVAAEARPAGQFMRVHRKQIVSAIAQWTGHRKYTIDMLARKLGDRCEKLGLKAPQDDARLLLDLGAYLSTLVTNHLHTGRFKRLV